METENEEEYLSLSKAAELLGVTTKTIRNWDDKGKIRTVRTPGNHRRIPVSEVTRLLQEERLVPGENLAILKQESEAYMGKTSTNFEPLGPFGYSENTTKSKGISPRSATITPSEYKKHLRLFGLEDIDALTEGKTELQLTPELNLAGELNRDELTNFTRLLVHKVEDILNARLKDDEFTRFSNMVASIHERAMPEDTNSSNKSKTAPKKVRPGKPVGDTPGVVADSVRGTLGYLE
jgi:excisionase family DNA binding protein